MNKDEANQILDRELDILRSECYGALVALIDRSPVTVERVGASGVAYQVEIDVFWDGQPGDNVRVPGSIDDGGWQAAHPVVHQGR